jgi:hypothetical protein
MAPARHRHGRQPDHLVIVDTGEASALILVEVDESTERPPVIRDRLRAYAKLFEDHRVGWHLLWVANSPERLVRLRQIAAPTKLPLLSGRWPAGTRITIIGLAGLAVVDESICPHGLVVRVMGVPADDDVGFASVATRAKSRVWLVLVGVLVYLPRTPLNKEKPESVGLEAGLRRERSQPGCVCLARVGFSPCKTCVTQGLLDRVGVGAAVFVAGEAGTVVVVAHHDRDRLIAEAIQDLVGPGCVAHKVAQHVAMIDANIGN